MILKFVMRDAAGAVVSGTPTVTADGVALTPTGTSALWQVDAPLGSLVSATLTGALPLDVMMPLIDPTALPTDADVQAAAEAAIVAQPATLTAAYDHAKDDVLTPLGVVADAIEALPEAQVGTRIDETSTDSDGNVLGLTTASGEAVGGVRIQAFAVDAAGHIDRSSAIRQTTSRSAVETLEAEERPVGSWELYLPAGTYMLVVTLDGYYDAADGDSEITRTVVVG